METVLGKSIRELSDRPDFLRVVVPVLRKMLWESEHIEGGAESAVVLVDAGGRLRPLSFRLWVESPAVGWEPVAYVAVDGTMVAAAEVGDFSRV